MARIKGRAGFGEASDYEAVDIDLDFDEVRPEYIPAVTREVPVLDDDGNAVFEDGIARTTTEVVTPGRTESQEEALARVLKEYLVVDEVVKAGVDNITATINFTITGSFDFDAQDWGLADDLDELDADDIDSSYLLDNFQDALEEAAREAARSSWESELELDVDYVEAE